MTTRSGLAPGKRIANDDGLGGTLISEVNEHGNVHVEWDDGMRTWSQAKLVKLADGEVPETWPNGVPYIDDETRRERLNDPEALRDLIWHLELHAAYSERMKVQKMTTEQKELYADVIDSEPRDFEVEPYDRWWRR